MLKDFRDFINRGNVIDLAVAVVIGTAFGAITTSLVNDVITPPLGLLTGGIDFSNVGIVLQGDYPSVAAAVEADAPVILLGNFLETVINFLIVAFAIFLVVRFYNRAMDRFKREKQETPADAPPAQSYQEQLLEEIRDLLAERA